MTHKRSADNGINPASRNIVLGIGETEADKLIKPFARVADVPHQDAIKFVFSDGVEGIRDRVKASAFVMAVSKDYGDLDTFRITCESMS